MVFGVCLRQPLPQFRSDRGHVGTAGKIGPLMRILAHVVEFLAAVGITDVVPAFGTNGMIEPVRVRRMGDQRGIRPHGFGVAHQRGDAAALYLFVPRQAAELDQSGIHVEQAHRTIAGGDCRVPGLVAEFLRNVNDERCAGGLLPECGLGKFLFADAKRSKRIPPEFLAIGKLF